MEDEYLDIVDENDKVVGKDLRSKIYSEKLKNKFIRYVNILAFDEAGLLLLPLRSKNRKIFPNCYDFSCGEHVQSGETYDAAAKRGIEEELGLKDIKIKELGKLSPLKGVSGFMKVYKIIISDKSKIKYDEEGIQSLEWRKIEDVVYEIIKNPSKFKGDLLIVLKWYLDNKN